MPGQAMPGQAMPPLIPLADTNHTRTRTAVGALQYIVNVHLQNVDFHNESLNYTVLYIYRYLQRKRILHNTVMLIEMGIIVGFHSFTKVKQSYKFFQTFSSCL